MRTRTWIALGVLAVACLAPGGCLQRIRIPVEFSLVGASGTFTVESGVAARNRGVGALGEKAANAGSGSVGIDPDNITVTPADGGGGKGTVNRQGGTLIVTLWMAPVEGLETVCESGEEYGPFSVELDENNQPVSVDPLSDTLIANTIELIRGRGFSLCLEVVSPINGTVTIKALSFNLGL